MKIVITGPESAGKSTLIKQLSVYFKIPFVDEYARTFIDNLDRNYNQLDLIDIAKGQLDLEKKVESNQLLLCDTDLLTIKIWSEFKYGSCDDFILNQLKQSPADLYLLCYPDIEWEFDKQRENPNNREELFYIYEEEIRKLNIPYRIIKGKEEQRISNAIKILQSIS